MEQTTTPQAMRSRLTRLSAQLAALGPWWIAFSLATAIFYQVQLLAPCHPHNRMTFSQLPVISNPVLQNAWRPRALSVFLARETTVLCGRLPRIPTKMASSDADAVDQAIGLWAAGWFGLAAGLFLFAFGGGSGLLLTLGMYAGVSFGYMPGIDGRVYPWDMPALFVFAVFVTLMHKKRYGALFVLVPLAIPLKETAVVLCVFPLLLSGSLRRRVTLAVAVAASAAAVKFLTDVWMRAPVPVFTMTSQSIGRPGVLLLEENITTLLHLHPLLANAGTLAAFLLVPTRTRDTAVLKLIAALMILGNMVCGKISEYRIWFEMIPVAMYGLHLYWSEARHHRSCTSPVAAQMASAPPGQG
jgi:hypothetical protein